MRNIIVATDGSGGGSRAVDVAAELATALGGKLIILTVAGNLSGEETRELMRLEGSIGETLETRSMKILTAAELRAQRLGATNIQLQIGWGDAVETIIETAGREAADAIVLGRYGRRHLPGLPVGSVSQEVMCLAVCPVIVVPELAERSPDDASRS
jgi:nucleotide-binding universal stress UspA family protein